MVEPVRLLLVSYLEAAASGDASSRKKRDCALRKGELIRRGHSTLKVQGGHQRAQLWRSNFSCCEIYRLLSNPM
jgi:hypothetical protein